VRFQQEGLHDTEYSIFAKSRGALRLTASDRAVAAEFPNPAVDKNRNMAAVSRTAVPLA